MGRQGGGSPPCACRDSWTSCPGRPAPGSPSWSGCPGRGTQWTSRCLRTPRSRGRSRRPSSSGASLQRRSPRTSLPTRRRAMPSLPSTSLSRQTQADFESRVRNTSKSALSDSVIIAALSYQHDSRNAHGPSRSDCRRLPMALEPRPQPADIGESGCHDGRRGLGIPRAGASPPLGRRSRPFVRRQLHPHIAAAATTVFGWVRPGTRVGGNEGLPKVRWNYIDVA